MKKSVLIAALVVAVSAICVVLLFASSQKHLSQVSFGVYLTEDDSVVFSDEDILSYNKTDHTICLTIEAANRTGEMMLALYHSAPMHSYVMKIDGEEIYFGRFVSPTVSRSYPSSEVIIVFPSFSGKNDTVTIQMGYPWGQPLGEDPRNNAKVFQFFEERGKLVA